MCGRSGNFSGLTVTLIFLILGSTTKPALAEDATNTQHATGDNEHTVLRKLLQRYCFECHGAETQEGNLRLDALDLKRHQPRRRLQKMLSRVGDGKMPPDGALAPSDQERAVIVSSLKDLLGLRTKDSRRSGRRTQNRRLTVEEYNVTMQSLFGVVAEFADLLPPDPVSKTGYRNDNERLGISSLQIESYLDAARRAVKRYLQFGDLDAQPICYHIELEDLYYSTADRYGTRKRAPQPVDPTTFAKRKGRNSALPPVYVDPLGPTQPGAFSDDEALRAAIPKLHQQYVAVPKRLPVGEMVVRVRAAGTADDGGRVPRMRVEAGIALGDGCSLNKRVLGETDVAAPPNKPATYEFRIRLEDVPTKGPLSDEDSFDRLSVFDMDQIFISNVTCDRRAIFALGRGGNSDPATGFDRIAGQLRQMAEAGVCFLHLDCLEVELLPGVGADNRSYRWKVPSDATGGGLAKESAVARKIIERFMRQAYRRPVTSNEIAGKLDLFETLRGQGFAFEESLQEALAAVLVSPSFLFIESAPPADNAINQQTLAPYQLASRLSYLLWLSPPDELLLQRAKDGSLARRSILRAEAERLLADPRRRRFLESFCRQWLRLDKHANVAVNRRVYSTYDDDFGDLSLRETLAYFVEVFDSDASVLDLIDSNYAILNDRLAAHYNVDGVKVGRLRKVNLPMNSARGGLLTQASVLTMNSDGVDSHPIRRGVWLLDRILNTPPPPPPPNVPELNEEDPDFRGLSLKERIALHRRPGTCQSCHKRIDPWGIPFENFDATGRWRDAIAHHAEGNPRRKPVDSATVLPDGQRINDVSQLKRYLRDQRGKQFANALVHHLLTYAMGRPPDYVDRLQVEEIQRRFAASQYRLRALVLAIVESPLFW